jgi:hypothetical protein
MKNKKGKDHFAFFVSSSLSWEYFIIRTLVAFDQCAQSLGRHHDSLHATINDHATALQIRLPGALARIQSVAARIAELLMLACEVTLCHSEMTSCNFGKTL